MMLHKNLLPEGDEPNTKHSISKVGMYHFDLSSTVTAGIPPLWLPLPVCLVLVTCLSGCRYLRVWLPLLVSLVLVKCLFVSSQS